ncbi:MAG: hypothetical protein M5U12_19490 [Verrucomicrobia bacterium]|nr:hypothetical protein [Verrucomicrobiota bacterium]
MTQLNDPVAIFVPVPPGSHFPKGYLNQSAGEPLDLEGRDGLLSLRRSPDRGAKIGNDAGALLWVGERQMLLVECPRLPEGEYPDGGASAEVWTNPDPSRTSNSRRSGRCRFSTSAIVWNGRTPTPCSAVPMRIPYADARRVLGGPPSAPEHARCTCGACVLLNFRSGRPRPDGVQGSSVWPMR